MEANAVLKVHVAWEGLCFSGKIMHMFETVKTQLQLLHLIWTPETLAEQYVCAQVFHTDSLIYYAEQKASGRELPKLLADDDVHQVCYEIVLWGGESFQAFTSFHCALCFAS